MGDAKTQPTDQRVMAVDLGDKNIGIALSDRSKMIARGFGTIKRSSRNSDFEKFGRIVKEQDVSQIVVGVPTLPSGGEGSRAAWTRDYAADLGRKLDLEVVLWDESFSSLDAQASLRDRGASRDKKRSRVDAVAAAFILQSYLDASRDRVERHQRNDE